MRMRKKKWVDPFLAQEDCYLLRTPEQLKEKMRQAWQNRFLEIGCGLGDFILGNAEANPEAFYLGFEKDVACVAKCIKQAEEMGLKNVFFIRDDAQKIEEWLEGLHFDGLYLLFSDPWPKSGYYKRRLTYRRFLNKFAQFLQENAFLYVKTDNLNLFEFTLEEVVFTPFVPQIISRDFHAEFPSGIMTGYERKFVQQGLPIYHLRCSIDLNSQTEDVPRTCGTPAVLLPSGEDG